MSHSSNAEVPSPKNKNEHADLLDHAPADFYAAELEFLLRCQAEDESREKTLGYAKLIVAGLTLVLAVFLLRRGAEIFLLSIPVVGFVVLAIFQEKLLERIRTRRRSIDFYQRGIARLEDRWTGTGDTGERFLDQGHPYARDLDLFGQASLFQYLSIAKTRSGEETLAHWLLHPARPEEVMKRQAAVAELIDRVRFRERIACVGEPVRSGMQPNELCKWAESEPVFRSKLQRIATRTLGILWILSLAIWPLLHLPEPFLLVTLVNFAYSHLIHKPLEEAAGGIERASGDLLLLSRVLEIVENEPLSSPRMTQLKEALAGGGRTPSVAIRRLARLTELIESRHSLFARPLDLVMFWSAMLIFVAERWQRRYGRSIRKWIDTAGEVEALNALAGFAYENPQYAFPEFIQGESLFNAVSLAHPLLPAAKAVTNDVSLGSTMKAMILSGPNMAGKSTFIRSIGVNTVLAHCGAPVCARSLRLTPLQVAASICVLDSLAGGISRFYAEIHRVKLIADLSRGPLPVLFLLDELLSGTNSHDRVAGTQFVVRTLVDSGAIGIVSTHDLAIAQIADQVQSGIANYHFEDQFEGGRLSFNYKLMPGVVKTSNALKLMQSIGLGISN